MAERKYDPEGTRRAILEAAQRIFVDKGVGSTSMTDIAKAANVTKSLIHHHFGSKDELWRAVKQASFERYFTQMLEIIRSDKPDVNPLAAAMEFTFGFHQKAPEMSRMLSWMHLDRDPLRHPLHDQVCREGLSRIKTAQDNGEFRQDVEAAWIQAGFLLLTTAYFQQETMFAEWDLGSEEPDGERAERYLRDVLKIFFEGVRPR